MISSVQLLHHVQLFVTPWTAAWQASLSITNSWSLIKLMSIGSVIPLNHLILCRVWCYGYPHMTDEDTGLKWFAQVTVFLSCDKRWTQVVWLRVWACNLSATGQTRSGRHLPSFCLESQCWALLALIHLFHGDSNALWKEGENSGLRCLCFSTLMIKTSSLSCFSCWVEGHGLWLCLCPKPPVHAPRMKQHPYLIPMDNRRLKTFILDQISQLTSLQETPSGSHLQRPPSQGRRNVYLHLWQCLTRLFMTFYSSCILLNTINSKARWHWW